MTETETNLAGWTTNPVANQNPNHVTGNDVAHNSILSTTASNVVPSTDFLRTNQAIQAQVDARLAEYQGMQPHGLQGKLKSQRGNGPEVPIKKFVAWPQHYVLIGDSKGRPTYDQLDPMKWMAGCIKGALDLSYPNQRRI